MEKYLLLIAQYNLKVGDRVVIPKSLADLIQHHAIYIGYIDGDYWFIENKDGFGVRTITAREFFNDVKKITRIERFEPRWNYSRSDLVSFALTLRGQKYDLLSYNCEDFCNQVQYGKIESKQVSFAVGVGVFLLLAVAIISINE